ncbi:MAG: hypothetical protein H0X33_14175 [Taibaiella sp.]|nr:hypothetical protein [Taibaiella sp.]
MPENIIIDFVANTEGLQPAEDRLAALGKIDKESASIFKATTAELNNRVKTLKAISDGSSSVVLSATKEQAVYNKLVSSLKNLSGETKNAVQSMLALPVSKVANSFNEVGVSVEEYTNLLNTNSQAGDNLGKSSATLRAQLRTLTNELGKLKEAGQENTAEFYALGEAAGKIKQAITNVGKEVTNFASSTRTIDNVLGSIQALASGYAAVEGAAALFGNENKDLQETLLKVTASMAVLQGVQGVLASVEKEGALSLLALNIQQRINNAQTEIEIGLQSESAVARGAATVAQYALNLAMSLNPVVALVLGLTAIVGVLVLFATHAAKAARAQADLSSAIKDSVDNVTAFSDGLKRGNEKLISDLEKAGAKQSQVQTENIRSELALRKARAIEIDRLNEVIAKNENSTNEKTQKKVQEAREQSFKMEEENQDALSKIYALANARDRQLIKERLDDQLAGINRQVSAAEEGSRRQLDLQKQAIDQQAKIDTFSAGQDPAKVAEIAQLANKAKIKLEVDFQHRLTEVQIQGIESRLILVRDDIQQEYLLKTQLLSAQIKAELLNTTLSVEERAAIEEKGRQQQLLLNRDFREADRKKALEAEINRNSAALETVKLNNQDRLDLQIANIELTSQIEIDATHNNANKIKLIYAQRDKAIREARLSFLKNQLDEELQLQASLTGNERTRQNERQQTLIQEQFALGTISAKNYTQEYNRLIDDQVKKELDANAKKLGSLNEQFKEGLISFDQYNLDYTKLVDDSAAIFEDGEEKKRKSLKTTTEQAKQRAAEIQSYVVQQAGAIGNILLNAFQNQLDEQSQRLDSEKAKIQDLQNKGKIGQQEAIDRLKKIDAEESRLKRAQAIKDKQAAIFNAIINTAQAVIKAYATVGPLGGPVFAAIAAAIGAAEIAVIASRPIPNFFTGKKDKYTGLARVGESGAELIEQNGQMRVTKKQEIVWLNAEDKVYTPAETSRMLATRPVMRAPIHAKGAGAKAAVIDYEKMGEAVGKHVKTSVYVNGVLAQEIEKQELTNYRQNRRKF